MPRGFTEVEKLRIRERLIEEGKTSFGRYGIRKTSIDELASAAGISKGAFYQFFNSKEELYFAAIESYETNQHSEILNGVISVSSDYRGTFKEIIRNIMNQVESDPFIHRILAGGEWDYIRSRMSAEQLEKAMKTDLDFSSQLVEIWKEKGKLKTDDPAVVTGVFRALFFLFLHKQEIGEERFESVIDLLLDSAVDKLISE